MVNKIITLVLLLLLIGGGCSIMDPAPGNTMEEGPVDSDFLDPIEPPPTYLDLSPSEIAKIFRENEDDFDYLLELMDKIDGEVHVIYPYDLLRDGEKTVMDIAFPEYNQPYGQKLRNDERFMACMWKLLNDCKLKYFHSDDHSNGPHKRLYFGDESIVYDPVMPDKIKAKATGVLKEDWYYFAHDEYGNILDENGNLQPPDPEDIQHILDLLESTPAPPTYPDLSPNEIIEIFQKNEADFDYLLEFAEKAEKDIRVGYCDELEQDGGEPYLSIWPERNQPYGQKLREDEEFIACMWKLLGDCRLFNLVLYSARHYPEVDDHRPPVLGFGNSIEYNQDISGERKASATGVLKEDWYYFAYDEDGNALDEDGNVK